MTQQEFEQLEDTVLRPEEIAELLAGLWTLDDKNREEYDNDYDWIERDNRRSRRWAVLGINNADDLWSKLRQWHESDSNMTAWDYLGLKKDIWIRWLETGDWDELFK